MNYQFSNDEYFEDRKFNFGNESSKNFNKYFSNNPLFSYDLIGLNLTEYNFNQDCFDLKDIKTYFEKVNFISKKSINDLIDSTNYRNHFHVISYPNAKLKELIKKISGRSTLRDEQLPIIGQFALYTDDYEASRASSRKSPRIYFLIGKNAIFYVLFYDPYHEIYPKKSKK